MPRLLYPLSLAAIALAATGLTGCDVQHSSADKTKDVHIAVSDKDNKVSLDIPGINANVTLPAINLGENIDMDGIKLPPDSSVRGVDVVDHDKTSADGGRVHLAFVNKASPDAVLAHFRQAIPDAGYTLTDPGGGALSGVKGKKRFALAVLPDGSGSRATVDLTGRD
jgi:hypothetical protein